MFFFFPLQQTLEKNEVAFRTCLKHETYVKYICNFREFKLS